MNPYKDQFPTELHNNYCTTCSFGGDLMLCDGCNQSFHLECLGIDDVPDDAWYCTNCVQERLPRKSNPNITTFNDIADRIKNANNILILCGAGMSVTAGIPDFRSELGLYKMLQHIDLGLTEDDYRYGFTGEDLFGLDFFTRNPVPFYRFFRSMLAKTESVDPTPMHYFLKSLDAQGKLLRIYTQNIDMLEQKVGISPNKIIDCHGSATNFTCMRCRMVYPGEALIQKIARSPQFFIPQCTTMSCYGVLKPDIIFFGEQLPEKVFSNITHDSPRCDLVLVIGSSMKVAPVSTFPMLIPKSTPIININRESVELRAWIGEFDAQYLGSSDEFALRVAAHLQWTLANQRTKISDSNSNEAKNDANSVNSATTSSGFELDSNANLQNQSQSQNRSQTISDLTGQQGLKQFYAGLVPDWVIQTKPEFAPDSTSTSASVSVSVSVSDPSTSQDIENIPK